MIVLDTNIVSELMKIQPDDKVGAWLRSIGNTTLTTTAVTVMEVEYGVQLLPDGHRKAELVKRFSSLIAALAVLPLDESAASRAGYFQAARRALGFMPGASDMMIAAIAATAGAALATRNVKDFEGLPIRIIDPWRAQ
jgi:predicted nucleic acid-binding protein